ncbi:ParB N-terminal domain-containing protein [Nonomuraea sp. NN258]|uniref:ParB N-terminal domain-containing protein n=1 Tax=Nonomuraea antri TaxID=2730852 RepID=UPI00156A6126|nr:ParB N-terminal domain-containing protein [Nonomuraea antri]NRQ31350.1 ParB N-terminal domain-containing protein [Nonomuraea antri]
MTAQPAEQGRPRMREVFRFGFFGWNISAAERIVEGREPDVVRVADVAPMLWLVYVKEDHAATVDLSKPLIVAPVPELGTLVIDGWHRIWKARKAGVETLPAVLLTPDEEHRVRMYGGDKGPGHYR